MAKYTNEKAYFSRLQELAQTKKVIIKEQRNIGTLIGYQRDVNGIAYGIIKENHNFYIKKGTGSGNLNASDFAYIGGLENIKMYQFGSISEAEKQRNILFHSINEARNIKANKTVNKLMLNEDVAGDEIEKSAEKMPDLEVATAEKQAAETQPEIPDLGDNQPIPTDGEEMPVDAEPMDGEEMPVDGEEMGGEESLDGDFSEGNLEIQKLTGKLAEKLRTAEHLEIPEVKSVLGSVISAVERILPEMDVEDRKKIADKLIKVVDQGEIDDLENSMPNDEIEEECDECGSFTKFAESRGFDRESIKGCSVDEMAGLISGYANAHNEGLNEGNGDEVALYANEEVVESLINEYGHDDYVNEIIKPEMMKLSESTDEDKDLKIDELWSGLKRMGSAIGTGIKDIGSAAGTGLKNAYTGTVDKAKEVGGNVRQEYRKTVQNNKIDAVNKLAQELKTKIDAMNAATTNAGGEPLDVNQVLDILKKQLGGAPANISNNVGAKAAWNMGKSNTLNARKLEEMGVDAGYTLAKPEMIKEDDEDLDDEEAVDIDLDNEEGDEEFNSEDLGNEESEIGFASPQNMGIGIPSMGTTSTGIDVNVDGNSKTVNIKMNEAKAGKYPTGHALAGKSTIKAKPTPIKTGVVNTKSIDKTPKKTEGHVLANKSTIKAKPTPLQVGTVNTKSVEKVAKKTEGHVLAKGSSIPTKPTPIKTGVVNTKSIDKTPKKTEGHVLANKSKIATKPVKTEMIKESETKIRKYIRHRLEEKAGLRKANLNESAKSVQLRKLDKMIDEQYNQKVKK